MLEAFAFAPGFSAAAASCGLKTSSVMGSSALDVALVVADQPCTAAAIFTTNAVKAAPVLYDQQIMADGGALRAVFVNAGNANACTGPQGAANTRRTVDLVAQALDCPPQQVFIMSTGVIGRQLDMAKLERGVALVSAADNPARGAPSVARAIMTTDTRPKVATRTLTLDGKPVTISGCCKGAGMIHPNMATLLAIVTTDIQADATTLDAALRTAANASFNRISVDGDTSTNDTLLLMASGVSGVALAADHYAAFVAALTDLCQDLAKQVARDGEGATRLIEIRVTGAADEPQAHQVANSIARSPLFKTAVHGADPNWGRVLCAAGYSGAPLDQTKLALAFGAFGKELALVAGGLPLQYAEKDASALLREDPVYVHLDLGLGSASSTVWTCDFSKEYVEINAHYTT